MSSEPSDPVTLKLSADAAIVLDALLSRFDSKDDSDSSLEIRDPAERAAVWELHCSLERVLVAPLHPDYERIVSEASTRLRTQAGL